MATTAQIQRAIQLAQQAGDAQAISDLRGTLAQSQPAAAPAQPPTQPTREQISAAFYGAKQAGDEEAARDLMGYIQRNGMTLSPMTPDQVNARTQAVNAQNVAAQPWYQNVAAGAGKSVYDTARGIGQLVGLESQANIDTARSQDTALANSTAGKVGDYAGQAVQFLIPAGDAAKVLGFAGKAAPYLGAAIRAGTFAATQPVQEGQSRLQNVATSAAIGAGSQAISPLLGLAARKAAPVLSEAKQAAIDTANQYDIPLHLSQVTDNKFLQTLGSAAKYLPFSGTTAADNAQRMAFNRALASTVGQDATELTPAVVNAAQASNSAGYNALFGRSTIRFSPQTWARLGQIAKQAQQDLPPDQAQIVTNQMAKYVNAAKANNGAIPGRLYQNIRQTVQKVEGQNQPSKYLVGQVRKAMQDAADQSIGPQDVTTLRGLNDQFKNLKVIQGALKQQQGANYTASPPRLWSLIGTKYGSTPEMRSLAQLGQTVLKDQIANSGTAQRELGYRLLLGGSLGPTAYFEPAAAGGLLGSVALGGAVGRVMNSPLAARTLPYAGENLLLGLSKATQPANRLLPLVWQQKQQQEVPAQ